MSTTEEKSVTAEEERRRQELWLRENEQIAREMDESVRQIMEFVKYGNVKSKRIVK